MIHTATVTCPVFDSFRVQQVAGMFDAPVAERSTEEFRAELPDDDDWQIGLVVGPSGSGKSTIAREAFGNVVEQSEWPRDRAVIDGFGNLGVRDVSSLLTAVGFSSPPSWIKPYHVLSNGEQFRCDLARALSVGQQAPLPRGERSGEGRESGTGCELINDTNPSPSPSLQGSEMRRPLVVFDEFTSVVDRTVAKVASAAVSRGIRRGALPVRFVAVTCHYDVVEWLAPDWVLDMANGKLSRRCLRRPDIRLEIHRTNLAAWPLFARHHYLSGSLARQARCYIASWDGTPVYFAATLPIIARKRHRRFTRVVTLPDFQGIGIGMKATEAIAQLYRDDGYRMSITSSHPALVNHCRRSPRWKARSVKKTGQHRSRLTAARNYRDSGGRCVVSFEYLGGDERSAVSGQRSAISSR